MSAAITGYVDVAQIALYIFWGFFLALVIYIRREDKREGYPLVGEGPQRFVRGAIEGFPPTPAPKFYRRKEGTLAPAPQTVPPDGPVIGAVPMESHPGAPLIPTGDPLRDGVGPAAWAMRRDIPLRTWRGQNIMRPLRLATEYSVSRFSTDPHGWPVVGLDGIVAGHVVDIWIDDEENDTRYLEIALVSAIDVSERRVLVPHPFVRYDRRRERVVVRALHAAQFAHVPALANPDQVTAREEDRLVGYYGGGMLYGTRNRMGPLL